MTPAVTQAIPRVPARVMATPRLGAVTALTLSPEMVMEFNDPACPPNKFIVIVKLVALVNELPVVEMPAPVTEIPGNAPLLSNSKLAGVFRIIVDEPEGEKSFDAFSEMTILDNGE